jgi:predicted transcriptional regulator
MNHDYYKACVETYKDKKFIISLIGEFMDYNQKDRLIPLIETVDPQKTLEYYTEHDVEKVPKLIELFNQYGKYEEFEL